MKKAFIFAAAAALVLAACSKNEIIETINKVPEEVAIGFSNYTPNAVTKANDTYTGTTLLKNGGKFAVMSYSTANGTAWASDAIGTNFMDKVAVTWTTNDTPANNSYSPTRYWPSGDSPAWLTFWAYYPVNEASGGVADNTAAGNNGIVYTSPTGSNGIGSFNFTVANTAADMVDFMVTDLAKDYVYGTAVGTNPNVAVDGVVPLTFHHALTKVQFVFQTDNADANTTITINSATLKNIVKKGTLTVQETFATATNATTPWTPSTEATDKGDYTVTINTKTEDVALTNATAGTPVTPIPMTVDNEDIFLMVPQEVTTGKNLVIVWTVATGGVSTQNTSTIDLSTIDIKATDESKNLWKANKSVVYTITVGLKPIKFTGTVTAWDTDTNAAISVN